MSRRRSGKPTMNDIAEAAGCSQTTVSFVLNRVPGHSIPEATRRRVAEAAIALGYTPQAKPAPRRPRGPRAEAAIRQDPASPQSQRAAAASLTQKAARAIAIGILSGRHPEDSPLPSDLTPEIGFEVSRTVLREAIRLLAGKGLVQAQTGIGTRVRRQSQWHLFDPDVLLWQADAGLDQDFLRHLGEMRLVLEPEAAALAAERNAEIDVAQLFRLSDRMAMHGISSEDFARADLAFHLAISAGTGNPFFSAISALIEVSLKSVFRRSWPGNEPGGTARSAEAHRAIAEAIADGRREDARAAMRSVIEQGIDRSLSSRPPMSAEETARAREPAAATPLPALSFAAGSGP